MAIKYYEIIREITKDEFNEAFCYLYGTEGIETGNKYDYYLESGNPGCCPSRDAYREGNEDGVTFHCRQVCMSCSNCWQNAIHWYYNHKIAYWKLDGGF